MVGAPLWIAAHAVPTGEGFVNEASKNGYRLLLSLFAKPALIVFGFFLSLAMFSAGIYLVNNTFLTALKVVLLTAMSDGVPSIPEAGAAAATGTLGISMAVMGFNALIAFVFGIIAMIFILVSLYLALAKWSFGLMNRIPDNALSWVGMQDISMGEEDLANSSLIVEAYGAARSGGALAKGGLVGARDGGAKVRKNREDARKKASADNKSDNLKGATNSAVSGEAAEGAKNASEGARGEDN